jgi:hypothetical protein
MSHRGISPIGENAVEEEIRAFEIRVINARDKRADELHTDGITRRSYRSRGDWSRSKKKTRGMNDVPALSRPS